jgi:hypothetical protein
LKAAYRLILLGVGVTWASLTLGYGLRGYGWYVLLFIPLAFMWVFSLRRKDTQSADFVLVLVQVAAGIGLASKVQPLLILLEVVAELFSWDMSHFYVRLMYVNVPETQAALLGEHMRRLLAVLGVGAALAGVALVVHFRLSFFWALVLVLLAGMATARIVKELKHE